MHSLWHRISIKAVVKNAITGKNNPMHLSFYNYRVEFQVQGAPAYPQSDVGWCVCLNDCGIIAYYYTKDDYY
jgi:hypothetical protein